VSTLRYVYGIVPAKAAGAVDAAGTPGIDATPVRAIVAGPFAAATSELDGTAYGEASINDRVRDLDWLTPRAAAHQAVNARLLEVAGVVLPLSFGALYRDDARVKEMLGEDATAKSARLDALAGRAEWVVTLLRDPAGLPVAADDLRALDEQIAASAPGKSYLLEKRRTTVASEAAARADSDAAERVLGALVRVAERSYREPVAKGGADLVVVRVSLLAPRSSSGAIDGAIAAITGELDPLGYRIRSTGPWPAYRFGSL
jgi:hypothetical protein